MRIAVFGLGYVGSVSAACLAQLGHEVWGVDVVDSKVDAINSGHAPVHEDGLDTLVAAMREDGRLQATTDATEAIANSDVALICVGTPSTATGSVDMSHVEAACTQVGTALRDLDHPYTVIVRSTSLPTDQDRLIRLLVETSGRQVGADLGYAFHPEFLREGSSLSDFFDPPKIVFGVEDHLARRVCNDLYPGFDAPVVFTDPRAAALVKYADNAFHAIKVTFANEIGLLSRQMDVDAREVMDIFVQDTKLNISAKYLRPGFAFGGSCLPKDLRALQDMARSAALDLPLLTSTVLSNQMQIERLVERVTQTESRAVGLIGLAFKEHTDDVRESPAVYVAERLLGKGYDLHIFDQQLAVGSMIGANRQYALSRLPHLDRLLKPTLQEVIDGGELVIVSHRLTPDAWAAVEWSDDTRQIVDLVGVPELAGHPGYDGLYW